MEQIMAFFTIKSRAHGDVTFHVKDEGGYVRVKSKEWDYRQPCEGGGFMGGTLMADEQTLEKVARRWWKKFLTIDRLLND